MKVHLSADYQSEIWFYPVYTSGGQLMAVEMVSQFVHDTAPVTLPQDLLLPQLDETQQLRLLHIQINLLEQHRDFFDKNHVLAFLRIDEKLAKTLLASELLIRKIKQLPFILLDVSETFPQLSNGINDPLIFSLKQQFRLSLSHFGAGKSSTRAVYDNLFDAIKLDRQFIQALAKRAAFQPFIQSIIDNISGHTRQIIICGIDDDALLQKVSFLPEGLIQGALFPPVKAEALGRLIADACYAPD
ncbi:EAL domain-containing protein [Pantoea sp. KPR_PJ]|uniref:EAL domain-containing protein n=1 Tax=Pantoea sp. KPR_PJ TaxID=2738375 RepID=UPI003528F013